MTDELRVTKLVKGLGAPETGGGWMAEPIMLLRSMFTDAVPPAISKSPEELQEQADSEHDRIAALEAIVKRLPKTADGVPVVPGHEPTKLYNPDYAGTKWFEVDAGDIEFGDSDREWSVCWGGWDYDSTPVSDWYSTREAAEAAKEDV
ncbi:MAG: hypothetical protein RIB60_06180 [Phycisphaerales bacterium]